MYVSILITLAPVLGKRMIILPFTMITLITLPPCISAAVVSRHDPNTAEQSVICVISVKNVTHVHEVGPLGPLGPLDAGTGQTRGPLAPYPGHLGHFARQGLAASAMARRPPASGLWTGILCLGARRSSLVTYS